MVLREQEYLGFGSKILGSFDDITITKTHYHSTQKLPEHEHERHNLVLVSNGAFIENYLGVNSYLKKGDLILHPKEQIHLNQFSENASVINIEINDNWINKYDLDNCIFKKFSTAKQGVITKSIFKLVQTLLVDPTNESFIIEDLLINIVSELNNQDNKITIPKKMPNWLKNVIELLNHRNNDEVSLKKISQIVNLHPVYLSRAFKKYTGFNLSEYNNLQRINKACLELAYTNKSVTQIALECSFYDQAHFIKSFKLNQGSTPLQYRKYIKS